MLSSLTPLKQQMAFQSFNCIGGNPGHTGSRVLRVPAAASLSSCASPGQPCLSHQPQGLCSSQTPAAGQCSSQTPASGLCSSRHQPRDSALPGTSRGTVLFQAQGFCTCCSPGPGKSCPPSYVTEILLDHLT